MTPKQWTFDPNSGGIKIPPVGRLQIGLKPVKNMPSVYAILLLTFAV